MEPPQWEDDAYEEDDGNGEYEEDDGGDVWDLEDALAHAILGDAGSVATAAAAAAVTGVSFRDEAEEERLIERLHAKLFSTERTATTSSSPSASSRTSNRSSTVSHASSVSKTTKPHANKKQTKPPFVVAKQRPLHANQERTANVQQPSAATATSTANELISPAKIQQMVTRFRLQEATRHRKLTALALQQQQQQQQKSQSSSSTGSSASTVMSPRSRELMRHVSSSFEQRQAMAMAKREQALSRQREQIDEQLRSPRPLAEAVRRPCICGSAMAMTTGDGRNESHTRACERFMETCAKQNATSAIQKKKQQMRRSIDDLMRGHYETKRKQHAMAEIQRQKEERETTFRPQINPVSKKIYEEMLESGRLQGRRSAGPVGEDCPESPLTQRPRSPLSLSPSPAPPNLTTKSKLVLQQRSRRRSSIVSRTSSVSAGGSSLSWMGRHHHHHRPMGTQSGGLPKAASFSESHWRQQRTQQQEELPPPSPSPSLSQLLPPPVPAFVAPWTTVAFDAAKCGFILQNFDVPATISPK